MKIKIVAIVATLLILTQLRLNADVVLPTVIRSFPMILNGTECHPLSEFDGSLIGITLNNYVTKKRISYSLSHILFENNLCSTCLCLGYDAEKEFTIEHRLSQLEKNKNKGDALFYIEVVFTHGSNSKGAILCTNIRLLNSKAELKNYKNSFRTTSLEKIQTISDANFDFLTNSDSIRNLYNTLHKESPKIESSLSLPQTQLLYKGLETKLEVVAYNVQPEKLKIQASNALVEGKNGNYIITPGNKGFCKIVVYTLNNQDTSFVINKRIRVRNVPKPILTVAGKSGSFIINKNLLVVQKAVFAKLYGFPIHVKYKISSFTCEIERKGKKLFTLYNKGQRIIPAVKQAFRNLESGDVVRLKKIMAIYPDKNEYELDELIATIK